MREQTQINCFTLPDTRPPRHPAETAQDRTLSDCGVLSGVISKEERTQRERASDRRKQETGVNRCPTAFKSPSCRSGCWTLVSQAANYLDRSLTPSPFKYTHTSIRKDVWHVCLDTKGVKLKAYKQIFIVSLTEQKKS